MFGTKLKGSRGEERRKRLVMDNTQSRSHKDLLRYDEPGLGIGIGGRGIFDLRSGTRTTIDDRVVGNVRVLDKKCTTMND